MNNISCKSHYPKLTDKDFEKNVTLTFYSRSVALVTIKAHQFKVSIKASQVFLPFVVFEKLAKMIISKSDLQQGQGQIIQLSVPGFITSSGILQFNPKISKILIKQFLRNCHLKELFWILMKNYVFSPQPRFILSIILVEKVSNSDF